VLLAVVRSAWGVVWAGGWLGQVMAWGLSGLEPMPATDRHAARVAGLRRAVFDSPGACDPAERAAAASGDAVPPPLEAYVAKVRGAAYRITDADVAALKAAGCSEEKIFEVTVAAAVGTALRGLEAGLDAMRGGS